MKKYIQICGDPTVDWFRIHDEEIIVRGGVYYWQKSGESNKVRLSSKPGGAAIIYQLAKLLVPMETAELEGIEVGEDLLNCPKSRGITTTWTVWSQFPNPGLNHQSYRLEKWHEFEPENWDYVSARLHGKADLLVIQDNNLGFRDCPEGWPPSLSPSGEMAPPEDILILLGQYSDNYNNPMLARIEALGWSERTTVVTTLSDLRACTVKIGLSLSWEQMLEEVTAAVLSPNCPFVPAAGQPIKFKQIIVTMGVSGAIIISRNKSTMIFDRSLQEGDFANHYPGQIMGQHACMLGAMIADWAETSGMPDWVQACAKGIQLSRKLHIMGFDVVEINHYKQLRFPFDAIADFYREISASCNITDRLLTDQISDLGFFSMSNDRIVKTEDENWTILEEKLLKSQQRALSIQDLQLAVNECARNIVMRGPLASLPDVPVETIGAWSSADRQEIEGVRSVKNAMQGYLRLKKHETPLCVAVFGPPGAGKSFVVKEIAQGLGIDKSAQLTFNLSQFESPDELQSAFHQIRDLNLQGKMPLVFWDEFDNPCAGRRLGWLRYFLAPMQDGEFTDHGTSRPLGGGIYVFAGATSYSFADFQRNGNEEEDRAAKKPDFISRLSAYINIRGINGNPNTVEDRLYMIRRAFILRQYLEIYAPQIRNDQQFTIEPRVLDVLLKINKYYHGARSLDNLIKMSNLTDKRKFELSSLPPSDIIGMHAHVKEFNALVSMGDRKTLRIGITGYHCLDPEQLDTIEAGIEAVLDFIEEQYVEHYLTVFSSLAAGADRLVTRHLLSREAARLIAILPLPAEDYINDFGSTDDYRIDWQGAELRREFTYLLSRKAVEIITMPASATRRAAYLKAGYFMAENSDIMIAIWNGNEPGSDPVTDRVVARCESLGKPICHIWADNFDPNEIKPSSVRKTNRCGLIRYKNFECHWSGQWQES